MKISISKFLKLSLALNLILAIALIVLFSQNTELKTENSVNAAKINILEGELIDSKRIAQEQVLLADRNLIRARVAAQKALANKFYARYQTDKATKE